MSGGCVTVFLVLLQRWIGEVGAVDIIHISLTVCSSNGSCAQASHKGRVTVFANSHQGSARAACKFAPVQGAWLLTGACQHEDDDAS